MKNIFLLLLLFTGMVKAQIVTIPDANFKALLLTADTNNFIAYAGGGYIKIDDNSDGEIQLSEAQAVDSLYVNNAGIIDLNGISSFNNLKGLQCVNNQLTELNISNLTQLKMLFCSTNPLTNIDLNGLTNLEGIYCQNTQISAIDLSGLVNLKILACGANFLTALDLSPSPNIEVLQCGFNQIAALDVSNLSNLRYFMCKGNALTSLNLSGLTKIEELFCDENQLTTLDLSDQNLLQTLYCGRNELTSLYIKNGITEGILSFEENPGLLFVCADEQQIPLVQFNVVNYGYTNCVVNTYCTFIPGGTYNTISGNIKYDSNNNGCDANDTIFQYTKVNINDGTTTGASFTDVAGNYKFYTQSGNFEVTPSIDNPAWFNFSPATVNIPFADNNNNTATQDFCISPNGFHPDVEVVISPVFFARPGFDATYQITYRNKGNQTVSGSVNLIFDDSKTDFVSANPLVDNLAVNSLSWNYSNLLPFESQTITVTLNVNGPTETPSVNIGDVLNFVVSTFPLEVDENPIDNTFEYVQTVVGSYDPNDITCLEGDVVPPSEIGNYLHYAINFENTGTFPAENVVVKTEVDAAKFDIGSLQLMNTNFPVDARISGNKVEFIFKNIQLPIGGHGHILLKIKTQNTLVTGDAVANRGDIFFDYNFPIDTGLANTVFQTLSNSVFEMDGSIAVYPNPAVNEVTITADNKIKSIQLYDAQGRIIMTSLTNTLESKLNVSSHGKGIYFIKIITDKGMQVQKLQKD